MNSLIIANNAPGYFRFFNPLAKELEKKGDVLYAFDSAYSKKYNGVSGFQSYIFSMHCESLESGRQTINVETEELTRNIQDHYGTWFLNPDIDRDGFYKIFPNACKLKSYNLFLYLVDFFVSIFKKHNIDYIFYENASNALALVAREVGRYYGAKFIGLSISRLPGRVSIVDRWEEESSNYKIIFDAINRGELTVENNVVEYLKEYIRNIDHIQPDYMKNNALNRVSIFEKYFTIDKLKVVLFKLRSSFSTNKWDFQVGNPIKVSFLSFYRNLKRRVKVVFLEKYQDSYDINGSELYYLYPLHFHPEASTSLLAREYGSEYEVIRNIAFSLPFGTKLYVKDHISAYGYPSLEFYKKIKKLPNVILVGPTAPTKEMIKKSIGVITLTSTVGYEALLLKKSVIALGQVFYEYHERCFSCPSLKEIGKYLKIILNEEVAVTDDYLINFVSAYYIGTIEQYINYNDLDHNSQVCSAKKLLGSILSEEGSYNEA